MIKICPICNISFERLLSPQQIYCSKKCTNIWQKGQHHHPSTEFKKGHKLRVGLKHSPETLKKFSEIHKGQKAWNKGISPSQETRDKIRKILTGRKLPLEHRENIQYGHKKRWNGDIGIKYNSGYRFVYKPNHPYANPQGYVWEHRFIIEKRIKRYLKPEEQVHHIDRNRSNNVIDNLILFPNSSEHMKYHHKIGFENKL